jgi:hypothetical protein
MKTTTLAAFVARMKSAKASPSSPISSGSLSDLIARQKQRKTLADTWEPTGDVHTLRLVPSEDGKRILAKARLHLPRLMARLHPSKPLQLQVCGKAEAEWLRSMLNQFSR